MQCLTEPRKPIPLKNIGSTCFINAAAQVVYAMHDFTSTLFEQLEEHKKLYKKGSLAEAYIDLLPSIMYGEIPQEGLKASIFCQVAWKKLKLTQGQQADANEFLVELLKSLSYKDIRKAKWALIAKHEQPEELQSDLAELFCVNAASKVFAFHDDGSTHESEVRSDISPTLDLKVFGQSTTLRDCLDSFFEPAPEKVRTNAGLVNGERHSFLKSTAPYLICSLERRGIVEAEGDDEAAPQYFRQENPLSFPLYNLSFKRYFTDQTKDQGPYELIGAIMHSGSANYGHYTAYVKAGNQWYYCNDETITKLNEEDMEKIATQGYGLNKKTLPTTLVYERSQTRRIFPAAEKAQTDSSTSRSSSSSEDSSVEVSSESSEDDFEDENGSSSKISCSSSEDNDESSSLSSENDNKSGPSSDSNSSSEDNDSESYSSSETTSSSSEDEPIESQKKPKKSLLSKSHAKATPSRWAEKAKKDTTVKKKHSSLKGKKG